MVVQRTCRYAVTTVHNFMRNFMRYDEILNGTELITFSYQQPPCEALLYGQYSLEGLLASVQRVKLEL